MGPNYFQHPIFILYWIALKKEIPLKEWLEMIKQTGTEQQEPIEKAVAFIEKYMQ
jgi:hypothetical protein